MVRLFRQKSGREIAPDEIFLDSSNLPGHNAMQFEGRVVAPLSQRAPIALGIVFCLLVAAFGVLGFVILAGLTSPAMRTTMTINMLAAAAMFLVFEYLAIDAYIISRSFIEPIFLLRQFIAVMFLLAVYFSTKTLRGTGTRL